MRAILHSALALCAGLWFAGLCLAAPAAAQAQGQREPPNYEADLANLSAVLGSSHYIARLCNGRSDQTWRNRMRDFMNLEGPPGTPRRAAMVESFNGGFRDQEERFPQCSPAAQAAAKELRARGARLTAALAARYR
ncbi:MAG: TIGR02301 family protein [Hyphomonadaceae bacterium]